MLEIPAILTFDAEWFPDPNLALDDPNGLLAIGGDLTSRRLINAYRNGIFPWSNDENLILWWSPDPRAIIHFDKFKCAQSLKKIIQKKRYQISFDHACQDVINACAKPRRYETETWITKEMMTAYQAWHQEGWVHSVEVWQDSKLVGGLYGVAIGAIFCGESMFSFESNTSKVALTYLVWQLRQWGFAFIDCQIPNEHLTSLGATLVPRQQFLSDLVRHKDQTIQVNWQLDQEYFSKITPV